MIVIADIAGQFGALERLVGKFDTNEQIILVGDLVDRGPYSAEVVEWAMRTERVTTLMGNHEHMMIDYFRKSHIYDPGVWEMNGGHATILSYDRTYGDTKPPVAHLNWLENRPLHFIQDGLLVTHAAVHSKKHIHEAIDLDDLENSVLWNRGEPIPREYFQVFGHNSHWGLKTFSHYPVVDDSWAICIDQSRKAILTAFHWPTGEIIEEPYLVGRSQEKDQL
jgi:serine/threonine protein phosphatase 1